MHLVFLMVKENILEVPSLPLFAKELGIEEVVLINICHTINAWQEQQRVFIWDAGENPYENILKTGRTECPEAPRQTLKTLSLGDSGLPVQ